MSNKYNENANAGASQGDVASSSGDSNSESLNFGSARSDYGDLAYGGTLNQDATKGASADSFEEPRGENNNSLRALRGKGQGGREVGHGTLMLLAGVGLGAFLMYLLDPEKGRRRRAVVRDKVLSAANDANLSLGQTARHLRNRAQGVVAQTGSALGSVGNLVGGGNAQEPADEQSQQSADEAKPRANAARGGSGRA